MTNQKNNMRGKDRLVLPLGTWIDEFEKFIIGGDNQTHFFHITDYVDNPWEHWIDMMYFYKIEGNDILIKCFFYQQYAREEDETEKRETCYLCADKIFTKWIVWWTEEDNYKDEKLNKQQKEWKQELIRLKTPHLIEDDNSERTPWAIAKIKSFLFYHTLGKEKAQELIENEIKKLWDNTTEEDSKELNEIKETWTIKRHKHYEQLYCFRLMRDMAKKDWYPQLEEIEKAIKELEEDNE